MKYLILGDIHGNLIALEKVKKLFFNEVDKIICHGDVVNYGPWSNECVDLLDSKNVLSLKGNHEEAFIKGNYPGNNQLVKQFFNKTFSNFTRINSIKAYENVYENDTLKVTHTINNKYYYPDSDLENLTLNKNLVIGHSHYSFINEVNGFSFVNTGSVGQNRKNLSHIEFVIYDDIKDEFEIIQKDYNANLIINEMKSRSYPIECVNYYKRKING